MYDSNGQEIIVNDIAEEKIKTLSFSPESFGAFWEYVSDDNITDVDYNGTDLWLTDTENNRKLVLDPCITRRFVENFTMRVGNQVSKNLNKKENLLEADTETLRISIIHESVAVSGRSVCIRKSLPSVRLTPQTMVSTEFCSRAIMNLMVNCVLANLNTVVVGATGAGKTEVAKFISQFIPNTDRVITIEDSPEWHYKKINPNHDCVELRINEEITYAQAIKNCLRQNPKWIMLSEARSVEVKYLIESMSTGHSCITSLHTDDIRHVPSRVLNMMPTREDAERLENDVYTFINQVLLVRKKQLPDGSARRYIDQLGFLYVNEAKENGLKFIIKGGELVSDILPDFILDKFKIADIVNPFECKVLDDIIGDTYTYSPLQPTGNQILK